MSITCQICGSKTHVIKTHLEREHPEVSIEQYQSLYPEAPLLSAQAEKALEDRKKSKVAVASPSVAAASTNWERKPLAEVFGLGNAPAAKNAKGEDIMIRVWKRTPETESYIPDVDPNYIFDIQLLRTFIMAIELGIPALAWGHAGTGKSTMWEQICAHTNRPFIRVQHTANTEEADIEGSYKVNADKEMYFDLGPLPICMQRGFVFCADEYDFGSPQVLSLYQAVLENKPLRIKSANLLIRPAEGFYFAATGNTNGAGDETGLYQGTQIQNAANYERFGVIEKVEYMPAKQEIGILMGRTGMAQDKAEKLVQFANDMRQAFDRKDVSIPMSPRAVFNAGRLAIARSDMMFGLTRSYINRLPAISAEYATGIAQRIFGGAGF